MPVVPQRFRELAEAVGGFDPGLLEHFAYVRNPLGLYHWSLNVIEILLIVGAVLAARHAVSMWRHRHDPTFAIYWVGTVVFCLTIEIPVYFPQLLGGNPNDLLFIHNAFTVGFFWGRTPLYILALYPALMYPAYAFARSARLFGGRFGWLVGSVVTGTTTHGFYEIFDHFGPQFGWWVWNYPKFIVSLASVPLSSMFTFAFLSPAALALGVTLFGGRYGRRLARGDRAPAALPALGLAVLAGLFVVPILVVFSPDTIMALVVGRSTPAGYATVVTVALGLALALTIWAVERRAAQEASPPAGSYPTGYLASYLVIFAVLWATAVPGFAAGHAGLAPSGLPLGSPTYVAACFLFTSYLLARVRMRQGTGSASRTAAHATT